MGSLPGLPSCVFHGDFFIFVPKAGLLETFWVSLKQIQVASDVVVVQCSVCYNKTFVFMGVDG